MDRSKIIAATATFFITMFIVVALVVSKLSWKPVVWPPEPDPYIAIVGDEPEEYIEVKLQQPMHNADNAAPSYLPDASDNDAKTAPESGADVKTQGNPGEVAPQATQKSDSPVKIAKKEQPEKTGASADNKDKDKPAQSSQTSQFVKDAFAQAEAKHNATNGAADNNNTGKIDGNPTSTASPRATGSGKGTVGGGWIMPAYSDKISSSNVGSVKFEVQVNKDGTVGTVKEISNSGLSPATVAQCRNEILKKENKYRHPNPEKAEATTATVIFTFRDPK